MRYSCLSDSAGVVFLLVLASCTGSPARDPERGDAAQPAAEVGGGAEGGSMPGGMMPGGMMQGGMMQRSPLDTAASPRPEAVTASAGGCPDVSQPIVDAGRRIFAGPGNCYSCHGSNAKGTALAPNLTDAEWLHIDGSYASIAQLVRQGVPKPKHAPAPMPPMGGAQLDSAQVCSVAAYVYSLGHHGG